MIDNAFAYTKNQSLRRLLRARAIGHLKTRPYTPRTNGKVERYQQTLQREWAYAMEYASSDARRESLPHWMTHYNESRSHSALGNRPPLARVREVTGLRARQAGELLTNAWQYSQPTRLERRVRSPVRACPGSENSPKRLTSMCSRFPGHGHS